MDERDERIGEGLGVDRRGSEGGGREARGGTVGVDISSLVEEVGDGLRGSQGGGRSQSSRNTMSATFVSPNPASKCPTHHGIPQRPILGNHLGSSRLDRRDDKSRDCSCKTSETITKTGKSAPSSDITRSSEDVGITIGVDSTLI